MTFLTPRIVSMQHIANQRPTIQISPMRFCRGPRCNHGAGKLRSIQQFKNRAGDPVFKYCALCRGAK